MRDHKHMDRPSELDKFKSFNWAVSFMMTCVKNDQSQMNTYKNFQF